MKLFEEVRPATLQDVSWLRRALRRELENLRIEADLANDVQLAIAEMATNAVVHATRPASQIGVRVDLQGASLRIEIIDDGAPFEDFERMWKAAARRDVVATSTSGLGLVLANACLRNVSYVPGGAGGWNRFAGWRPLTRQRAAVLIVEDDPTLLSLYSTLLRNRYRIHTANSVDVALGIAETTPVDLILSDYHLGEELGTLLLKELERDAERLPVPVIMLSADRNLATRASADGFGIELFLNKPVTPKVLQQAVDQTLTRSRRRLAGLFRYFGASVERLLLPPSAEELQRIGADFRMANATAGGGDFVLHLPGADRDRLILVDIMGHGLKAKAGAIAFSAILRSVHASTRSEAGPGAFLAALSELMRRDEALSDVIATLLVADRLADGTLEFSSAAHPLPVLVGPSSSRVIEVNGPLMGLLDGAQYPSERVKLEKGERIVLVTDGVEPQFLAGGGDLPPLLIERLAAMSKAQLSVAMEAAAEWANAVHGPSPRDDWTIVLLDAADAEKPA